MFSVSTSAPSGTTELRELLEPACRGSEVAAPRRHEARRVRPDVA
jgi:hypothetical protein